MAGSRFFERLCALCALRGVPVTVAVIDAGGRVGSISGWRNGSVPHADTVAALALRLSATSDYLLGLSDDPAGPLTDLAQSEEALIKALRAAPEYLRNAVEVTALAALGSAQGAPRPQ